MSAKFINTDRYFIFFPFLAKKIRRAEELLAYLSRITANIYL
jgi:hypothetical protein